MRILKGIAGIVKALGRVDVAYDEVQKERLSVCEHCEHRGVKTCGLCGCFVELKVKVATESCPAGYWRE